MLKVKEVPAALWKRVVSYLIDLFLVNLVVLVPFQPVLEGLTGSFQDKSLLEIYAFFQAGGSDLLGTFLTLSLIIATLTVAYWTILEYKIQQSVGDVILHLFVRSETRELTLWQCVLRNISKVSTLPAAIDSLLVFFTPLRQRYFEKASKTYVVEQVYAL